MDMTVYAVQMQMQYDKESRSVQPRFPSISKADEWGQVEYLLDPSAHPFNPDLVIGSLHHKLSGFSDDDYLLLIGNPVLIGMASAVAARYNDGKINFLQWNPKNSKYVHIFAQLY
jgi:hypothetical protein